MISSTGFHLLVQAAEASRNCTPNYDSPSIAYHQDFREHINGFVSPDNTSVDGMWTSSSLPPKKRLRLQASLCQNRQALVSPMIPPFLSETLRKKSDTIDTDCLTDSLHRKRGNGCSMNHIAVGEQSHSIEIDAQSNHSIISIDRKRMAATANEQKKDPSSVSSCNDAFGNSIHLGYFSGINTMISPEIQLKELKNLSHRSDSSDAKKEKEKPCDQDIFGNTIGMGYFSCNL